ncbi:MAG: Mur ligase family protein, partial [Patescibacteria group bacterium]
MTYPHAEQFLLSLSNLPRRRYMDDTKKNDVYLKRLKFFLNLIGNPEKKIPHYIHVTGTSGKGSVSTFLASILSASGQKTGLMISPHPTELRERWQINGVLMPKKNFVRIIEKFKPLLDRYERESPYDALSFFDLTTAIGLFYFAQKRVSWAVLEVGCGGRLDSTNVIPKKDIAVITNVGLDHTEVLGDTKEKIAFEKAGIITRGCRVFTMEKNPNVLRVIERECKKKRVKISDFRFQISDLKQNLSDISFSYQGNTYKLSCLGTHQAHNAALCIDIAHSLNVPTRAIQKGLSRAKLPLRMEIVQKNPLVILDGAHNPDKIKTTVATVQSWQKLPDASPSLEGGVGGGSRVERDRRIHLILGFSENKNIAAMLRQ